MKQALLSSAEAPVMVLPKAAILCAAFAASLVLWSGLIVLSLWLAPI